LFKQKQWAAALTDIDLFLKKANNSLAWLYKGYCEYDLNRKEEACQSWRNAAKFGNKAAVIQIKKYCIKTKNPDRK